VISPVLVQPDPTLTVVGLGVLALLVGALGERIFGTGRWIVLFGVGGLTGHLVGEAWEPYSSGISVAFCGVLGALVVWVFLVKFRVRSPTVPQFLVMGGLVVLGTVYLLVIRDIHGAALTAGLVAGVVIGLPGTARLAASRG